MLLRLGPRGGGGSAAGGLVAAAALAAEVQSSASPSSSSLACSIRRHFSANAPPSDGSSSSSQSRSGSSSSLANDPRWKSPLFDALLSLAARSIPSPPPTPASTSTTPTSSPPIREVVSERQELWTFFADAGRHARSKFFSRFVRTHVEAGFDELEFYEGAADARHAVFDALSSEGSLSSLKGAVAPGLLGALYGVKGMHGAAGLSLRISADDDGAAAAAPSSSSAGPSASPPRAVMTRMSFVDPAVYEALSAAVPCEDGRSEIRRRLAEALLRRRGDAPSSRGENDGGGGSGIDDAVEATLSSTLTPTTALEAASKTPGGFAGVAAGKYLIVAVRFTGSTLVQTFAETATESAATASAGSKEGDGAGAEEKKEEKEGNDSKTTVRELVRELIDKRSHVWRFARGPLPESLPVRDLGLPWVLLSIGAEGERESGLSLDFLDSYS